MEFVKTESSRKSTSPVLRSPRIIFLAHGIASWLVKRLLAEADGRIPVAEDDKFLTIQQVESIIFLQDFPHSQTLDVSYTNYIEEWVNTLLKLSFLEEDWLGNRDDIEDEGMADLETDGKKRLLALKQRLRWIDDGFRGLSANQHLSSHVWVLDPHLPVIDMRHASNLPDSHLMNNEKHAGAVHGFLRRHRNSTTTARGVTVNVDVGRIDSSFQILSTENNKGPQSNKSPGVGRLALVSKEMNELGSHLYFTQSHGKFDNIPNRPQATHHRSSSAPQGAVTGLMFPEYAEASKSPHRPYSYPPSKPAVTNDEEKWRVIFDRARRHLLQGDLENADILCKWCADIGDQFFGGTDIPLQWRMRRAVIQILRGQYRDAYTQLRNILMICFVFLEVPDPVNKAWKITEKADEGEYLPKIPWPTRRPSDVSGVDTSRSQDFETGRDVLNNLFILSLELSYNIAVALTQMGKFQEAEDRVKELRRYFLGQHGTTYISVQKKKWEERRQRTLLVDATRLLALLEGYKGEFSKATRLIVEVDRGERSIKEAEETNYGPQSLTTLTHAKIMLSCGMIQDALQLVTKSLPEMEKNLGKFHLTSLETRCLKALLLSKASRALEAEDLCSETNELIKRHLGDHHPLVLDIIHVLVSVCEIQARPLQALRISENLCIRAEETLGPRDQRTIRFQAQQAWIHVWMGNYEKGEILLQETYNTANLLWGPNHPWTLEYIPKLAFTYYLRGKTSLSTKYFSNAFRNQMVAFSIAKDEHSVADQPLHHLVQQVLSTICLLNTTADSHPMASQWIHPGSGHKYPAFDPRKEPMHPDILFILELWAETESHNADANQELLLDTRRFVYNTRKASPSFGRLHVFTLRAGLGLAKSMTESPGINMALTEKLYDDLYHDTQKALDPEHPLVLSARQGLQTVKLVRDTSVLKSPVSIADFFVSIQKAITFRLGNNHPDVLRFSLDTFTLLMVVDSERAEKVSEAFLGNVRSKPVWEQRAIESVRLQEQLAWSYFMQKRLESALEILHYLTTQLGAFGAELDDDDPLCELGIKISQAERIVRKATEDVSVDGLREKDT